jgi:hypothetical protein
MLVIKNCADCGKTIHGMNNRLMRCKKCKVPPKEKRREYFRRWRASKRAQTLQGR